MSDEAEGDPVSAGRRPQTALQGALRRYLDARGAALLAARTSLGIGELDARALLFIAENPGTRPTRLREYLGVTSAGVTTLIDRLVERGAVRRDVDPEDRRVNRITVTVDLDLEPWSALTRFDTDFDTAIGAHPTGQTEEFASLLDTLTTTTRA
ncbi:MAG: MarR family transcriptional regulator [Microbacterium sp.]|uniref:MarR family winged helix-turn-helix transcriptional regulator n=1 Tax=Microbacterium sp. TaxID=51671 RepID=UPI001AC75259|nr:MarR family transcriptional regulator [Microbacterium sp.]MBN9155637.1 MarR family transcriptional regulator [Microbacterium sp.]